MFVTYAYGGQRFVKLALLCLLSIKARRPEEQITVYTDDPAFFAGHGFTVKTLSKAEIAAGQAPVGYRHRVKIEVLLRHALESPEGASVVYVDSDTYFKGGEVGLKGRPWVMHHLDGLVGDDFYPRFNQFLKNNAPAIAVSPYRGMSTGFKMYNSGLIGFSVTLASVRLLHAARQLTDWLCVRFPEQNEWAEQIALAWIGETGPGVATDAMGFDHYWHRNSEVAALVGRMTVEEISALAADAAAFDALQEQAKALKGNRWHRLTVLRKKRWDRSLRKRAAARKARELADPEEA